VKTVTCIIGIALLVLFFAPIHAQEYKTNTSENPLPEKKKFDWSKVYFGGGLGLQFWPYTYLDLSPTVGYRITDEFSAGVGVSYQYFSQNNPAFETHIYGGSIFARYVFMGYLFGHAEYQLLNSEFFEATSSGIILNRFRKDVSYIWIGGGYRQKIAGNSYFVISVLYNLNESGYSIYPNPIYRMGVSIGF